MYRYIDVHSHVALDMFGPDGEEVFRAMKDEGIGTIVVGVDRQTSKLAADFAAAYENVWATVGIHPEDGKRETFDEDLYASFLSNPKVVAVGECGLDYYRLDSGDVTSKERQNKLFAAQIAFAAEYKKPLMIHGRPSKGTMDAYEDILTLLRFAKERNPHLTGNVHFFVGTPEVAEEFFKLNFTLSFSGVITFTHDYDEVVRRAPLKMIHAETDSPYATPAPHRGKRNDSRYLPLIVAKMAELRGEDGEVIRQAFLENARRVFGSGGLVAL